MKKLQRRFFIKSSAAVSAYAIVNPGFSMGSDTREAGDFPADDSTEIALNCKWAEDSFPGNIPFSFVYGGKNSAYFLGNWKSQVKDEEIDSSVRKRTLTLNDPETGLEIRAIATVYTDTAGVDWTIHFTNNGSKDTPVLEQVKAVDVTIDPGDTKDAPVLQRIHGGGGAADDWMPFNETLAMGTKTGFAPTAGRSSFGNTPWFNLQWKDGGVITAIGWTGQWKASLENDNGKIRIQAGMQNLHTKLLPGETIRSPRIMQLYWKGKDSMRAFNLFRHTMFSHIIPKVDGKTITPPIVHLSSAFYEMDKGTEADTLSYLDAVKDLGFEYFWVDAYYGKDDFPTVGNYVYPLIRGFNRQRYPHGMKQVGDAVKKAGMKFLMWFEYERICPGTLLATEHPDWVVLPEGGGWGMFNLGIPEAREYITRYLSDSIREYGISWLRVDNAVFYEGLWAQLDKDHPDRTGISEIRYVEGHYRLWDDLLREFPFLAIDNCAAGGHRVDLETCSRSIPLWRTDGTINPLLNKDFNQAALQNQVMTAGLSRYVPFSASGQMGATPYLFRSGFNGGISFAEDVRPAEYPLELLKKAIAEGKRIRKYYFGNFYPLTPVTLDTAEWCVIQYHLTKEDKGMIMAFRRPQSGIPAFELTGLREIVAGSNYRVTMYPGYEALPSKTMSGKELLRLKPEITELPGSFLIEYEKV